MNQQDQTMLSAEATASRQHSPAQVEELANHFAQLQQLYNDAQGQLAEVNARAVQLHQTNEALRETVRLQQVSINERPLPQFKLTAKDPPAFDGDIRTKPAHVAQKIIDEYLHRAADQARLYGLLADGAQPTFQNQTRYVDWISSGLTGHALTVWRNKTQEERDSMTFKQFRQWIQTTFSSKLTLTQANDALDNLKQLETSAPDYSVEFNSLVSACEIFMESRFDKKLICVKYRNGLNRNLQRHPSLFELEELDALQQEAHRLDDLFRRNREDGRSVRQRLGPRPRYQPYTIQRGNQTEGQHTSGTNSSSLGGRVGHQYSYQHQGSRSNATPMELDNLQGRPAPLSDEERKQYYREGWCTFCRSHSHVIRDCEKRRKLLEQRGNSDVHPQRAAHVNAINAIDNDDRSIADAAL